MRWCPTYSQYRHEGLDSTDMYSPSSLTQATLILTLLWETRGALSHCIQLVLRTFLLLSKKAINIIFAERCVVDYLPVNVLTVCGLCGSLQAGTEDIFHC